MDPLTTETAAPPAQEGAAAPSFADQWNTAATEATPPPPAAPAAAAAPPAQGTPPPPAAAADAPPAWLADLGGEYKSPDEVKQALGKLGDLQKNQLTDEMRVGLRLLNEPEARREYLQLLDADYTAMDDEAMLFQEFKALYPGMSAEDAETNFQLLQDQKYPGLAEEPGERAHKAAAAMRKAEADQVRGKWTANRDTKLADYSKAALKPDGPTAEDKQRQLDLHLENVDKILSKGAEAFKMTLDVNGKPLNLAVEAADLPAIKAVLANPYAALQDAEGNLDYNEVVQYALWKTQGTKFLGLAQKAALEGQGPVVNIHDDLHNGNGNNPNANPAGAPSFMEQLVKAGGGAPPKQLKY